MREKSNSLWAVVPAAGIGQRMRSEMPKQYFSLHGRCVLEHSLESMLSHKEIQQVVVCVAQSDTQWATLDAAENPRVITTLGGDTRADSVLNGLRTLKAVADDQDWVLVHDAARPCLSHVLLDQLIQQVKQHDVGGILAVPVQDTLKQSQANQDNIRSTVDRSKLWQAQTPQMFRLGELQSAIDAALLDGVAVTDESSAMEYAGYSPTLVRGDAHNVKITTPEDLIVASAVLGK